MAANTVDAVKSQDKHPVDSDSDGDDDQAEGQLLYVTKPSQICHDRILPRDLHTTQKSVTRSRQGGPVAAGGLLRASAERRKIWHKKTLNVCFVEFSPYEDIIFEWAREWSEYCGIQFKKVSSRFSSDIRIGFHEDDGAWSYVGTDCAFIPLNELTMNLGFIDRATVLHEFGHAIGLIHEHQSPTEGGFEWNKSQVIKDSKGPPNYWDLRTIRSNIFFRYKKSQISGTKYDRKSIMHYSFPASWIQGKQRGIPYNYKLSKLDKKLVRKLYGPPRAPVEAKLDTKPPVDSNEPETDPSVPAPIDNKKLKLSPGVPVYEGYAGVLKSSDDELMLTFHTSTDEEPKLYTIVTQGDMDTMISLLGPDDPEKFITADDNSGECKNAKIERVLFPDSDYYVLVRTFDNDGGEFKLFITVT